MGVIKQIWMKDESLLILQKMMQDGITLSDWVNKKIQEYDTKVGVLTREEAEEALREYNPMEEGVWQIFEKAKPSLASRLKNIGKEELETVINDDKNDEITKSFARVFLKKLEGKVK